MGAGAALTIVVSAVDKASPVLKNINKTMLITGAAITAVGVIGAGALFGLAKEAGNAQEVFSRFGQVFNEVGDRGNEVAKDLRDNFGLATSSAKSLLASTGDLLIGMGMAGDEALNMSETIAKLGVDLASFQDLEGGATQAVNILNRAILGERESLKTLGVAILDADVKQRMMELGMSGLTGTARLEAQAIATLQLVMEQTEKAQGDYSRTSEDFNNQMRLLTERTKELKESLGKELLPMFTKIVNKVTSMVEWFNNLSEGQRKFTVIAIAVGVALALVVGPLLIIVALLPALVAGFALLTAPVWIVIGAIAALVAIGVKLYKNWDKIKLGVKSLGVTIGNVFIGIANIVTKVWNFVVEVIENSINRIISLVNKVIKAINKIPGIKFPLIPNIDLGKFKAAEFALMEKPTSESGTGSTTNVNIENVNGLTGRDLANSLQDELENKVSSGV